MLNPFTGDPLVLFDHPYNATATNERAVEIPLALAFIDSLGSGARWLEVGDVTGHYRPRPGVPVIDLSGGDGVEQVDVMAYAPVWRFDGIVAVSTVEHVGVDEPEVDEMKAAAAIRRMRSWLRNNGRLLVTIPCGYHRELERQIHEGQVEALDEWVYARHPNGGWVERSPSLMADAPAYDFATDPDNTSGVNSARAVWVGVFGPP